MEIRQLKYFAAVADTLNFSRAAETLFISQSALSKQIADLERELGMVLLQRDKRSVRLTPAGDSHAYGYDTDPFKKYQGYRKEGRA